MKISKEADAPSQNSCWEDKYSSNAASFQPVLVEMTNLEIQMKVKPGKQHWIWSQETWATGLNM